MRRADFLTLTGVSADAYGHMLRGQLLPYLDSERRGWSDYSERQVVLTCLTIELAPLVGSQAEAARRVADMPHEELSRIWAALFHPAAGDVWAASFTYVVPSNNTRWVVEKVGWQISLVGEGGRGALAFPTELVGADVTTLPMINLSTIVRGIEARAAAAGIAFREDVNA